jgi:hypothetical protein
VKEREPYSGKKHAKNSDSKKNLEKQKSRTSAEKRKRGSDGDHLSICKECEETMQPKETKNYFLETLRLSIL